MTSHPQWDEQRFFQDLSQHIAQLQNQAQRLSDAIRFEPGEGAFHVLETLIEGCLLLVQCLMKVEEIQSAGPGESQWRGAESALGDVVRALLSAFEKRDFVLVADLLEYDLIQTLTVWDGVIKSSGGDSNSQRIQTIVGG